MSSDQNIVFFFTPENRGLVVQWVVKNKTFKNTLSVLKEACKRGLGRWLGGRLPTALTVALLAEDVSWGSSTHNGV